VRFEFEVLSTIGDPLTLFTLTPCRVVDTRDPAGPLGGPALAAQIDRPFPVVSSPCGVPSSAKAIAVNIAVTGATSAGNLRLHAGGTAVPAVSSINYGAAQTRANNAVVTLSGAGEIAVYAGRASGTVHLILDVTGYFE